MFFRSLRRLRVLREPELLKKTYVIVEMYRDRPGELSKAIQVFDKHGVNMSRIESRLKSFTRDRPEFHIDFVGQETDAKVQSLLLDLKNTCVNVAVMPARRVVWFPTNIRDLDDTLDVIGGDETGGLTNPDHPGFHDKEYRERRESIVALGRSHRHGTAIQHIDYTPAEIETWGVIWDKIKPLHSKWACSPYNAAFEKLEKHCGFARNNIPQLDDISNFLQQTTGFSLKPVPGLLSARDFLNALAFRVFYSTQYVRHGGNPFYTPEPDCVHELIGHVPLFADPDFADFSQEIGLASLGASDEDIMKLSSIYWFTIEFGLMEELGQRKVYGAGILSSFGEMEWSCADEPSMEVREKGGVLRDYPDLTSPKVIPLNTHVAAATMYPITTYQPLYFSVKSFAELKDTMSEFCDSLLRPFHPQYDAITQSVGVDKSIVRQNRQSTAAAQCDKQKQYFDTVKENLKQRGMSSAEIPF
eukprot:GEMP01052782.1.p1 GENE.GEMP01052782.1~~GEMP01052782.1.p1  ORF type:complete len:472 (-),score=50.48 GEMP01052782.1:155-1570(-)